MGNRRQPSEQFLRRLKAYSGPKPDPVVKPESWIRKFHEGDGWLYTEAFAFVVVAATIWQIWVDLEDRKTQRITQAWQLVTQSAPGNSGKGPALEFLKSQGIELVGINLSTERNQGPVYLDAVNLSGAYLRRTSLAGARLDFADLSKANLSYVNLSKAELYAANLSEAVLWNANLSEVLLMLANLSGANLSDANLSGANLGAANLSGAYLGGANLSGADFSGADLINVSDLDQGQLDTACGDEKIQLPEGLTIEPCPDK